MKKIARKNKTTKNCKNRLHTASIYGVHENFYGNFRRLKSPSLRYGSAHWSRTPACSSARTFCESKLVHDAKLPAFTNANSGVRAAGARANR